MWHKAAAKTPVCSSGANESQVNNVVLKMLKLAPLLVAAKR
jgi:hypothetical protein